MEWVQTAGGSVAEAKEVALDRLGVHEDDAEFEVVNDVTTGLFGRVKEEARVRARVRPATPRVKEERGRGRSRGRGDGRGGGGQGRGGQRKSGQKQGDQKQENQRKKEGDQGQRGDRKAQSSGDQKSKSRSNNGRNDRQREESRGEAVSDDEPTMPLPEQADIAEEFVRGLAERFGTAVSFEREDIEDDEIRITVNGEDLGRMVGRRGTTAGAIDELVRTVLQRQAGSARNGRIRVDVGGVRARRAAALGVFALAQAEEVRSSGLSRSLEPMGAADRKVVHDALTDEDGVETLSEGEDPRRRVVIVAAGDDG